MQEQTLYHSENTCQPALQRIWQAIDEVLAHGWGRIEVTIQHGTVAVTQVTKSYK